MRILRFVATLAVIIAIFVVAMRMAFPLPDKPDDAASTAIAASEDTFLGGTILPLAAANPGKSGVYPLADGRNALAARVLLARAAEETIDAQYYIWQRDTTSWLLMEELRAAAERGVRVRLLLDDNGIPGLDNVLAGLNDMPTVEVRLFNPFTLREPKLVSYLFDFPRLNRRMHNKSMTVDGAATIIGGRNIGDIYFAYGDGVAYFDLDVLTLGQAATDVSDNFDLYWDSASAYPAETVLPKTDNGLKELSDEVAAARESVSGSEYLEAISTSPIIKSLADGKLEFEWTEVTLVSDDPRKGLGEAENDQWLLGKLPGLLSNPEERVDIVSAYLIPGESGTDLIETWLADGVETRLMTNSLEATDVAPVHSAWMNYRDQIVRAGGTVLELRARPDLQPSTTLAQMIGGSLSSLHAKTFSVDNKRIFIGSFNFDPRSASLNTEMGFLIESPRIASELTKALDQSNSVYVVEESPDGDIVWRENLANGDFVLHQTEPGTSAMKRGVVQFLSWLPVEWML